jgi:hypothetical protein
VEGIGKTSGWCGDLSLMICRCQEPSKGPTWTLVWPHPADDGYVLAVCQFAGAE